MKLRYERGALADLDEIFAYIAEETGRPQAGLLKTWPRGLPLRHTSERRHASPTFEDSRLAAI
jgi:hypothetical protein